MSTDTKHNSEMPTCPICGQYGFYVDSTWTTIDGLIHRRRVCEHCDGWGFQTVETPEKIPKTCTNGKVGESSLTNEPQTASVGAAETKPERRNPIGKRFQSRKG